MLEGHEYYVGREQTWVKHYVLRKYLERFAHIIGSWSPSITYVDGFSGPWNIQSNNMSDSSFSIALAEFRKARDTHHKRGKRLRLRCIFLEQNASRFSELNAFAKDIPDAEVLPLNSSFEEAIPDVIRFIDKDRDTFPFIFIDPTGWTGFSMQTIAPLLKRRPCEVIINFMLDFIRRFIEQDFTRESFANLFGSHDFDAGLKELKGLNRDDAICERYCRSLREVCGFNYVQRAIVLHPDTDKTHFMLIYGTRNLRGVEVFKSVEEKAMEAQETSRALVEVQSKNQPLFDPNEMPPSAFYTSLRDRYLGQGKSATATLINTASTVPYDHLWARALSYPLVWESDLRQWLKEWRDEGCLRWDWLTPRGRELMQGRNHSVSLIGSNLT